jgi:aminoglycoside/choline kinase family phosphotransferase
MPKGERLFRLLAVLMMSRFYGKVIIRFQDGKATYAETDIPRTWQYQDRPGRRYQEHP